MKEVFLLFPHQLFYDNLALQGIENIYLIEEKLFFTQYAFHKQKLVFHRSTMQYYKNLLEQRGFSVTYINSTDSLHDVRILIQELSREHVSVVHYYDVHDDWLQQRIEKTAAAYNIGLKRHASQLFINTELEVRQYFSHRKKYFHHDYYVHTRKKMNILLTDTHEPVGGKWSFDEDNRKKYPKGKKVPQVEFPVKNEYVIEAMLYVEKHFNSNPGSLHERFMYPTIHASALEWLHQFLSSRFQEFGVYEDSILQHETILHHSVLSPLINVGLITPKEVLDAVLSFAHQHNIPLNSLEGFVRQLIGWREFIRGVYETAGVVQRTKNHWQFTRKIPASFYDGTTGIVPVDSTIKKVLETGYCHHIERLMILGNFMLLCEFHPDEVYKWFMELFIDAYDWVMVPNVYGMSQFADGGLMSTKPYISGSSYLLKMSDYKKGDWCDIWDGLFWRFMHVHRDTFNKNPRLSMLLKNFDKMESSKRNTLLRDADLFLQQLDD